MRYDQLKKELKRVGVLDRVEFQWDFPSPFKELARERTPATTFAHETAMFSIILNHYRAIKTSYLIGCEHILIMEDDIRFLNDVVKIEQAIKTLPSDYDFAMFDRMKPSDMGEDEYLALKTRQDIAEGGWKPFESLTSGGCYSLSRRAMERLIEAYEKPLGKKGEGCILRHNDYYFRKSELGQDLKMFFVYPNVAVQAIVGNGESHSNLNPYWVRNKEDGIKKEDYNLEGTLSPIVSDEDFINEVENYQKNHKEHGQIYKMDRIFNSWDFKPVIPIVLGYNKVFGIKEFKREKRHFDGCTIWGYNTKQRNRIAMSVVRRCNSDILFCEPGFISSGTTFADKKRDKKYRLEHSMMIDKKGQYFDATVATDLECLLNEKPQIPDEGIAKANQLIAKIVDNKISKYNHQPIKQIEVGTKGRDKVLVIDQSYGDFSIKKGLATEQTFTYMLSRAITDNPNCDILVKTHPDTIAGKKGAKAGYYSDLDVTKYKNVYKITEPINPYSLMEGCTKIYVCTSQFGFEGLMAGKEVHVFGMPWYAGWGATIDYQVCERRTAKCNVVELFYMFYMVYTKWVLPEEYRRATIEEVIDRMIQLRKELLGEPNKNVDKDNTIVSHNNDEYEEW